MPRRHQFEDLSPRALARLRSSPRAYVPTELDLRAEPAGAWWEGAAEDRGPGRRDDEARSGRHARATGPRGWARLPTAFVGARWQPGRAAVLGVVLVAVLAVAVFGLRVAWARSAGEGTVIAPGGGSRAGPTGLAAGAVPVGVDVASGGTGLGAGTPTPTGTGGASAAAGAGGPAAGGAGSAPGVVVVHVVGEVRRPGVQELPAGSRVSEAVEAAGGATGGADLARVNLARVLVDGEQVRVPAPGDPVDQGPPAGPGGGGGPTGPSAGGGLVPLNTADLATLDTLPGVGPVLAQRILDWRTAHGRFTSVDELGEVSGIGEKLLAQLTPLVTV